MTGMWNYLDTLKWGISFGESIKNCYPF